MSTVSTDTRSSTISDFVDAETEIQTMLDTLNQRLAAVQLRKSKRTPTPIPFEEMEWVVDAKSWSVKYGRPKGKSSQRPLRLIRRDNQTLRANGQHYSEGAS